MTSDLNWLDDDYSHAAWQQMQEELQRRAEDERDRYRAAHPLWDKCVRHPERERAENYHYCAECLQRHQDNYADGRRAPGSTYEYHGPEILGSDGKYHREQRLK